MINPVTHKNQIIDVVKYRWVWFIFSLLLLIPGLVAMVYSSMTYENHLPFRVGIDFVGGTIFQYSVDKEVGEKDIAALREELAKNQVDSPVIQILHSAAVAESADKKIDSIVSIRTRFAEEGEAGVKQAVSASVTAVFPESQVVSVNSIGPTLGKELFKNSMIALILALVGIAGYLAYRFQMDYALVALLSLVHDAVFVCGIFSILGIFYGVHIDALFITAILTVMGFSIHDTIVVYDRIRENYKFYNKKLTFSEITNASVNQTLARSINTSLTTLLTLIALYFFGGVTTKDFVFVMILGIIIGTYSSIFFASTLLAWVREKMEKGAVEATA